MKPEVDIVLPCYRPGANWHKQLQLFYEFIKDSYSVKFILVNDGSPLDNITAQVAEVEQAGIPILATGYNKNWGKGHALRTGVRISEAPFVIYTDVDFPFTHQSMADAMSALTAGNCDVVAGYRNQAYYKNNMPGYRKVLSRWFRFFLKRVLNMPVTDTQCGLKGFNRNGKKKFMATAIRRYLFDFEFIYTSLRDKSIIIKTVPVELKENVVFSKMKLKILLQESLNLLYVLIVR